MRREIETYLAKIDLKLNQNWQVFPLAKRAIDFLGIRFYRDKTTLRKRNSLRIRRRMKKINSKETMNYLDACAIVSYWGWIKRTDSHRFYNSFKNNKINIREAKYTISRYAKEERIKTYEL